MSVPFENWARPECEYPLKIAVYKETEKSTQRRHAKVWMHVEWMAKEQFGISDLNIWSKPENEFTSENQVTNLMWHCAFRQNVNVSDKMWTFQKKTSLF